MSRDKSKTCTATCSDGSECNAYAVTGKSVCYHHGGASSGAPEGNQNAQKHALFSTRDGYYHDLSDSEQEWLFDFTNDLLDRHRRLIGTEPDMFDKEALKNIAIDFHRVAHANAWFRDRGLAPDDFKITPQGELVQAGKKTNEWAKEIRQYNESLYNRMKKHGLLNDPESQKAESQKELGEVVRQALE